jgi:ribulose 1,5-bisphosphate synthetase/thiazole synthase
MALDATSRETCTVRRVTTNTPVSAFALMNDPVYVEAAQALARRIVDLDNHDAAARAVCAFRNVLERPPLPKELHRIVSLFNVERERYDKQPDAAAAMAASEIGAGSPEFNVAELAAWTVVGNVLLNLDEALTK